jgi:Fic family protein
MQLKTTLTREILGGISRIDEHRAQWASGNPVSTARLVSLAEQVRIQSTAAASRLSGIRLADQEVAAILEGSALRTADDYRVKGYANALCTPFAPPTRPLRAADIGTLHALALVHPLADRPSDWRSTALIREAFTAAGQATGRVFSTLAPRQIEPRMRDLTAWFDDRMRDGASHPIASTATFVLGLLAASPFPTGNGRVAFLAFGHLLRRAGYPHLPYASLEAQIEDLREEYQESFDVSQTRFWTGEARIEPWLEFCVRALDRHRERVDLKIALEQRTNTLPPLQQAILETVREHGTVRAGLLLQMTGANRNTLKDNLRRLVDQGVLQKHGERRGTLYRMAPSNPALDGIKT